ncbi:hypothetical protein [Saccharolobus caldissimus]|uniref:Uncharacterized protein n=1 Tax=Saccharolobus caldissimus TaxID=1702097 RepID=A0AAQ4CT43_9CREN|nr:hypothetical protein [Saccharolobus caldissimus]BDB98974.1 hypothetical protein SACC_19910 [Saccharolobus caldissimus]
MEEELQHALSSLKRNKNKENVISFLKLIRKYFPPSDDFSITLWKSGIYEYVLDRRGIAMLRVAEDEYLPYMSAYEKRLDFFQIPENLINNFDWKSVLKQLRDIVLEYSKRDKNFVKIAEILNDVILKNI